MIGNEVIHGTTLWKVERYDEDATKWVMGKSGLVSPISNTFESLKVQPYLTTYVDGNLITTAGWTRVTSLMTAGGGQAMTNTSARIGVGNGTTTSGGGSVPAAAADTNLAAASGSSNRWFQIMDATYPTTAANVITCRSTFGTADGNFAWNEFGIDIGTPTVTSGNTVNTPLFNHKTSIAQGTKASGQTWVATATVTLT